MKKEIVFLFLLCISLSSRAVTYYVDHTITTPGTTGTSWAQAFPTVDDALAIVVSGDVIKVSQGTYPAANTFYTLKEGVRMYGGYPAPGTVYYLFREMYRNPDLYPTVLSGSPGIRITNALSAATYVDGFKIQGGNVGLQFFNTSANNDVIAPIFANCTFTGIQSGVEFSHKSATITPQFNACNFTGSNIGLKIRFIANSQLVAPNFSKCIFFANTKGVALESFTGNARPKFMDCIFRDNTGYAITNNGTGIGNAFMNTCPISTLFDYHPQFINSKFYNNGGILDALVSIGCPTKTDVSTIFSNCTFNDNAPSSGTPAFNLVSNNPLFTNTNTSIVFKMNNCISSNNLFNGQLISLGTAMVCHIQNSMIESGSCNSKLGLCDAAFLLLNPHAFVHQVKDLGGNVYGGNPLYVNPTSPVPDLRLQASSPARNTGNNALIPIGVSMDFEGLLRHIEPNVDMGAHEYCPDNYICHPAVPIAQSSKSADDQNLLMSASVAITIYPNPVNDVLNIQMTEEREDVKIQVFNSAGQVVKNESFQGSTGSFDFSALPPGIYTILVCDDFTQSSHLVIKQ